MAVMSGPLGKRGLPTILREDLDMAIGLLLSVSLRPGTSAHLAAAVLLDSHCNDGLEPISWTFSKVLSGFSSAVHRKYPTDPKTVRTAYSAGGKIVCWLC